MSRKTVTISQLLSLSRCDPETVLIGRLEVVEAEDTLFPRGAIVFYDATGELECHVLDFQLHWLSGEIVLKKWNLVLNKLANGRTISNYIEVSEVELRSNSSAILNKEKSSDTSIEKIIDILQLKTPASVEPLKNAHIVARVAVKSVLQNNKGLHASFVLTLNDISDSNFQVYVIFSGNDLIKYYMSINIGKIYILTHLLRRDDFLRSIETPVFQFNSTLSTVSHCIDDDSKISSLIVSNISSLKLQSRLNTQKLRVMEQSMRSAELSIPLLTYQGTITCILDKILGVFVLDSRCIVHLGLYSTHYSSLFPFRVGMNLILHNVHTIPLKLERDIWKLSSSEHCPSFNSVKTIFAACHCSTIQIEKFPTEQHILEKVLSRPKSKFSLLYNSELFTLLELLWIQSVYYDILEKFPGGFGDETLLGDSRTKTSAVNDTNGSLLSKLLQRHCLVDRRRDLLTEFFDHKFSCHTCKTSHATEIKFPILSKIMRMIDEIAFSPSLFDGNENEYTYKVISQREAGMENFHLMGILQGSLDGTLQIKDHTCKISVVNIAISQKIHTFHLNNIWIIPKYDIVIERPGKTYIQFAIDKCYCFYAKPSNFSNNLHRCIFHICHVHTTKINGPSEEEIPKMNVKIELKILFEVDNNVEKYISFLSTKQHVNIEHTYVHLSDDFVRLLPAIHVGSLYEFAYDESIQKQMRETNAKELFLNSKVNAQIRSIRIDNITTNDSETITCKDLFNHIIGPAVVQVDEAARNMYKTLEARFLDENKILNISDILYGNSTESTNDNNRYCDSIVSFRGILISKEYRIATTLPKFLDKFILGNYQNEELYLHNKTILLRIRDIITMDVIDVYVGFTSRYTLPLGIIPGRHLVLKLVAVKTSVLGTIYCYSLPISHVALDGLPIEDSTLFQQLKSTYLIDFPQDKSQLYTIYLVRCTIIKLLGVKVYWICEICDQILVNNSCSNHCSLAKHKLHTEGKFEVRDGTSAARVFAKDELVLRALMSLNDDSHQKICLDAARKKIEYSWKQSENINRNWSKEYTNSIIGRDINLFCQPLFQKISGTKNIIKLKAIRIENISPTIEAYKRIQHLKQVK
ncbi:4981_t:CDS:1 [Dentiscutata erythropus]|uniref:CST complex subunit CTC1 n=1 Tax=Dentiscutata erythropus TaxID=1348616 RepID=A0A9N9BA61_9GLOM|nr:4981_t:CDS:1 [Dentiscutata erythropus]